MPDLVIGAILALCGVLVAQLVSIFQGFLERKHKREILLRTKYEELGAHFLDSLKQAGAILMCKSADDILVSTKHIYGNNIHLLAMLYFPLLKQATGDYLDSFSNLIKVAGSLYNPLDPRYLTEQLTGKPEYDQAYDNYLSARNRLHAQIEANAITYARS